MPDFAMTPVPKGAPLIPCMGGGPLDAQTAPMVGHRLEIAIAPETSVEAALQMTPAMLHELVATIGQRYRYILGDWQTQGRLDDGTLDVIRVRCWYFQGVVHK